MTNPTLELLQELERVTLFGGCKSEHLKSAETERKEKERKLRAEKKKREIEVKKEQEELKRQEEEDYKLALEEQEKLHRIASQESAYRPIMSGRGVKIVQIMQNNIGRGRSKQEDDQVYKREAEIRDEIHTWARGDSSHSNITQRYYWNGSLPNDDLPSYSSYPADQFEDAVSSLNSSKSVSPAFQSISNSTSPSPSNSSPSLPIPSTESFQTPPGSSSQARKPRISRLAAKFSNMPSNDEDQLENAKSLDFVNEKPHDFVINKPSPVQMSSVPSLASSRFKTPKAYNGFSINDLNASQRVLSHGLLRPEDLMKHPYALKTDETKCTFVLDNNDFPPLQ